MKNFFKSRSFIVLLLISMLLCILPSTLSVMGHGGYVRDAVSFIISPVQRAAWSLGESLKGFSKYFARIDELSEENAKLREENEKLKEELYLSSLHEDENEWLRQYLELKRVNYSFELSDAKVIGMQTTNTKTVYTLDKGSSSGIVKNMPVITDRGIVGYIIEVGLTRSKAVAVTDERSGVGVYTERTGAVGVLVGTYELSFEGKCEITCIQEGADIAVGDRVITSGMGGVYPEGLAVGVVSEVYVDPYDRSTHAVVVPYVDFSDVDRVMILTGSEIKEN